jgi:hypothetical protein
MSSKALYLSSIFGCALELAELLKAAPKESEIICLGNYFDLGPNPLEVFEILMDHQRQFENLKFLSNMHERQLVIAAGMDRPQTHENASWISPYSGTAHTIQKLGINPWELLALDDSPLQKNLRREIERRNWQSLLLAPKSEPFPIVVAGSAVFGGRMTLTNSSGLEIHGVAAKQSHYRTGFIPWLHREISQHSFGERFSLSFDEDLI